MGPQNCRILGQVVLITTPSLMSIANTYGIHGMLKFEYIEPWLAQAFLVSFYFNPLITIPGNIYLLSRLDTQKYTNHQSGYVQLMILWYVMVDLRLIELISILILHPLMLKNPKNPLAPASWQLHL